MPTLSEEQSWVMTASLMVLAAVAAAGALLYTRKVMIPFVLAVFLSYLVSPLVDTMQIRLKLHRGIAVFITLLVVVALIALLVLLITTSARELAQSADIYQARLTSLAQGGLSILDRFDIDLGQRNLLENIRKLPFLSMIQRTAGTVVDLASTSLLVFIFVIYLLAGRHPNRIRRGIYAEVDTKIRRYILIKFTVSAITGILVGSALSLFGLDLALVFGVMAFLLNFIPSVGSVISTLLPLPLALVQFESLWMVAAVVIVPGLIQIVIGNGIEPKIMGEGLDLHPVTILLGLVFWGLLWGVVGMLLAAPIMAVVRLVLSRFETTRAVGELLAGRLPEGADQTA